MHVKEIEAFNPFIETAKILWWMAIYKSLHLIKECVLEVECLENALENCFRNNFELWSVPRILHERLFT